MRHEADVIANVIRQYTGVSDGSSGAGWVAEKILNALDEEGYVLDRFNYEDEPKWYEDQPLS